MSLGLQILRALFGLIAAWQMIGLLPVLTDWMPNLDLVTSQMWGTAIIKSVVMVLAGAAFVHLGQTREKKRKRLPTLAELPLLKRLSATNASIGLLLIGGLLSAFFYLKSEETLIIHEDGTRTIGRFLEPPRVPDPQVYGSRAWTGNIFHQFDDAQVIEEKARAIPSINNHRAWAAIRAWQHHYIKYGAESPSVALYMAVDKVLLGLAFSGGICRPGEAVVISASKATPQFAAGTELIPIDCASDL